MPLELFNHYRIVDKVNRELDLDSFHTQIDRDMSFPDAARIQEDEILRIVDKPQCSKIIHYLFVDRGLKFKIGIIQGFLDYEFSKFSPGPDC